MTTPKPISWADSLPKQTLRRVLETYRKFEALKAELGLSNRSNPNDGITQVNFQNRNVAQLKLWHRHVA